MPKEFRGIRDLAFEIQNTEICIDDSENSVISPRREVNQAIKNGKYYKPFVDPITAIGYDQLILALSGFGIFLLIFWFAFSYSKIDPVAWRIAKEKDTPSSYRVYLQDKKDGKHRAEANQRLFELFKEMIVTISKPRFTPEGVKKIQEEFPDYDYSEIDKLFFEDVERQQDITYYESYLKAFPNGDYALQARKFIFNTKLAKLNEEFKDNKNDILYIYRLMELYAELKNQQRKQDIIRKRMEEFPK